MKKWRIAAGLAALAGTSMLAGGCSSTQPASGTAAAATPAGSNKPVYRVFEKGNQIESSDQAECLRLFDHRKDNIELNSSMAQIQLKAGAALKQRLAPVSELYYVFAGAGMITINGVAYVLRENSGVYVPANSQVTLLNNGNKPFKCLIIAKTLPWLDGQPLQKPLTFDKADPKMGESKTYQEIVGEQPQNMAPTPLTTTTLTPSEAKVDTLTQEKFTP